MGQIALLDSGVWAANFLETDMFNSTADGLIVRLMANQTTILVPEIIRREIEQSHAPDQTGNRQIENSTRACN